MIKVQPYSTIVFKNQSMANRNDRSNFNKAKSALSICAGVSLCASAILIWKNSAAKMSYGQALNKNGVELKNNIAYLKNSSEKYTGIIKRNITINKKETVKFENGQISERLYHNIFGKELDGEFYRNGELYLKVGNHIGLIYKSFPFYKYENGNRIANGDIFDAKVPSIFKWARDAIKKNKL